MNAAGFSGRSAVVSVGRLLAVAAVLVSLAQWPLQILRGDAPDDFSRAALLAQNFGYFTVLSNLGIAAVWAIRAFHRPRGARWTFWRGLATTGMTVTGIVYWALLWGEAPQMGTVWSNLVVHLFAPLAAIIGWVADPPPTAPSRREVLGWFGACVGYAVVMIAQAQLSGWYPYPFLDLGASPSVLAAVVQTAVLGTGIAVIGALVAALGRLGLRLARARGATTETAAVPESARVPRPGR